VSESLPNGWVFAEINEVVADQSDGKRIHQGWSPQCEKVPCDSAKQWGVLKTTAIQAGEFQWQHHKRLPAHLEARADIEVSVGDILLTCAGPRVRCGVACLVRSTRSKLMLSGKIYRFRAVPNATDESYLEAFLQTQEAQLQIDAMKTGGSDSGLNLTHERFKKLRVRLAPFPEQIRIVAKLEELLSDLDAGVAELKAAQKKLAQYRQSLLKAAVEGVLTADWRARHTPTETGAQLLARILTERRSRWEAMQLAKFKEQGKPPPKDWQKKYPEPVPLGDNARATLSAGWTWASVDQLTPDDLANGRSVPSAASGAKVLRLTAVRNGRIDLSANKRGAWTEEEAKPFAVVEGDLLIVRGNGSLPLVGRAALVPEVHEQVAYPDTLIRLRVVESVVRPAWLGLMWDSETTRSHLEGRARTSAGIYKISQPDIVSVAIPVPPLAEQDEILEVFSACGQSLVEVESMIDKGLKQSTAQRQNILRAAFAGQLVPQDPSDEPASALLARIRAGRAKVAPSSARRGRRQALSGV
jgi:type I restriction enzyme S subunit